MKIKYIEKVMYTRVNGKITKGEHYYTRKTKNIETLNKLMKKIEIVYAENIETKEIIINKLY